MRRSPYFGVVVSGARAVLLATLVACGGSPPPEPVSAPPPQRSRRSPEPSDGAEFTGLMGSLSTQQVDGALQPRMSDFVQCLESRSGALPWLSGDIRMGYRVRVDGSVLWVHVLQSSLGDLESEDCVLSIARAVRFPRPRGGEAEFSWGFGMDAAQGVRPPVDWPAQAIEPAMIANANGAIARCGGSGVRVTAYVRPGGQVAAAGTESANAEGETLARCLARDVLSWPMPDPGSYAAKVSFVVTPRDEPAPEPVRRSRRRR